MEEVLAQLTQIPVEVNVKPVKTAIKSRKGLPAFIWVIGKKKYTLRDRSLNHSRSNRIIFLALTNFLSLPNCHYIRATLANELNRRNLIKRYEHLRLVFLFY